MYVGDSGRHWDRRRRSDYDQNICEIMKEQVNVFEKIWMLINFNVR